MYYYFSILSLLCYATLKLHTQFKQYIWYNASSARWCYETRSFKNGDLSVEP